MRSLALLGLGCLTALLLPFACVDPLAQTLADTVDVLVVDGTITNVAEPMVIRLNRSHADRLTGRSGTLPVTKATVEVILDSSEVISCHETINGSYQLPNDFKGQINHAYQLRFTLSDGTRYISTQQVMPSVPPISRVTVQFNPTSLSPIEAIDGHYRAAHDVYLDTQDPVNEHNYYRWSWMLYEPQEYCRTCYQGIYAVNEVLPFNNGVFQSTNKPFEDCVYPPASSQAYLYVQGTSFDYFCRTQCWEILYSHTINVFDDKFTNGGLISRQLVAQVPFYQHSPCLVDIRQEALTKTAYEYFNFFQQQTQSTGGLTDTPPTVMIGNIRNEADPKEKVIGYFTASAVSIKPYYIDRKDTDGIPPTLFYALNGRIPNPESPPPPSNGPTFLVGGPVRPPTAVCGPIDQRTPIAPIGWPN
ncbi:DUF4249 domain-containing protein [Spirosoma foliorum]|uniref:DUF4249 domain-containing protein n=1 Tax=Spirosoma foliorum TaxID=2710596 RepID=A0A7G5H274_9BACT|nr:DUF4249 domain-containing protein [Spirosoma foliorum]QMW05216.1 DUF4249 domain-containing protein [Spirosoma foliorum]